MRAAVMVVALSLAAAHVLASSGEGQHRRQHRRRLHQVRLPWPQRGPCCWELPAVLVAVHAWGRILRSCLMDYRAYAAAPLQTGKVWTGYVARWADGDSLTLDDGTRVRLHGIDAPESSQTCKDAAGLEYQCGERQQAGCLAVPRWLRTPAMMACACAVRLAGQVSSAALRDKIGASHVSCEEVRSCRGLLRCRHAAAPARLNAPHASQLSLTPHIPHCPRRWMWTDLIASWVCAASQGQTASWRM